MTETCAVDSGGRAFCWGRRYPSGVAVYPTPTTTPLRSMQVGAFRACGLDTVGQARCSFDMVGRPEPRSCPMDMCVYPLAHPRGEPYAMISMGYYHACALDRLGALFCWGENMNQLGIADSTPPSNTTRRTPPVVDPTPVQSGVAFRSISAGSLHSCALDSEGRAYCWGRDYAGEAGSDSTMASCAARAPRAYAECPLKSPTALSTSLRFTQISAGRDLSCGVATTTEVYCWGRNTRCQLGRCDLEKSAMPVRVPLPKAATAVSAGHQSACAITTDHHAYCWGDNHAGQLGAVLVGPRQLCTAGGQCAARPVLVDGDHRWQSISMGEMHACGVTTALAVYCWGSTKEGRLAGRAPAGELCENFSAVWKDEPCARRPVRIDTAGRWEARERAQRE